MEIIERVGEHYEVEEVEGGLGKSYKWCPECVVLQCDCGKRAVHRRSSLLGIGEKTSTTCECGEDFVTARIWGELVYQLIDEDYEANHHPWRYWHPSRDAGIPL